MFALVVVLAVFAPITVCMGQDAPAGEDEPVYVVETLELSYFKEHVDLPPIQELMELTVKLGLVDDVFVAPKPGVSPATFRLAEVPSLATHKFRAGAIRAINVAIASELVDRGFMGIYVAPHWEDISQDWSDVRPAGNTTLRIVIYVGVLSEIRTVGTGERVPVKERINHPVHSRIIDNSPIKEGDLLKKKPLTDYVSFLNRHAGRNVDMALSSTGETGDVVLDYMVHEVKPWFAYYQLENSGTTSTDRCRHRMGFIHNQLTGADDVLSLDYTTAGFDDANAYTLSYERPLFGMDRLRWRIFGNCSDYKALDIGPTNEDIVGDGWMVGGELIANIYQKEKLFIDAVAGAKWRNISAHNKTPGLNLRRDDEDLFLPHVGLRLERITPTASTRGDLTLEWTEGDVAGTSGKHLDNLGRFQPDEEWTTANLDIEHSFFLEPLINREAWLNPGTPEEPNPNATLAHEIALIFKGQYSFGRRLIPQYQTVMGGFHSVRGYEESVVAGDSSWLGTLEYRYHIPRSLRPEPNPAKIPLFGRTHVFRLRPQQPYSRPDWDLILRAFFDMGETFQMHRQSYEDDETLIGTGFGLELQVLQNLTARADWGFALKDADDGETDAGDSRVHLGLTLIF